MRACNAHKVNLTKDDKRAFFLAYRVEDARKCNNKKRAKACN